MPFKEVPINISLLLIKADFLILTEKIKADKTLFSKDDD